jgi:hypothetical protein
MVMSCDPDRVAQVLRNAVRTAQRGRRETVTHGIQILSLPAQQVSN